jgi:hypothetical protein
MKFVISSYALVFVIVIVLATAHMYIEIGKALLSAISGLR